MTYAIIGFGKIGQALAHAFARKNINDDRAIWPEEGWFRNVGLDRTHLM